MKGKKFLAIIGITALVLFFALNTSFAASSEKINPGHSKNLDVFDKKVVTITQVSTYHDESYSNYFRINIKKAFQNKYKIKSVQAKISEIEGNKNNLKIRRYTETHVFKNKDSVIVKIPDSNDTKSYQMDKITIFYQTKSKIKNESEKFTKQGTTFWETNFKGKKANIVLKEKFHVDLSSKDGRSVITSQNFKIKTINSKDKIKSVKINYYNSKGFINSKTVKGNGKSVFNFNLKDKLIETGVGEIVVNYV